MIKGKNIILRTLTDSDANLLFEWINDPELRRLSASYWPVSIQEHRIWFDKISISTTDRLFGITERNNNRLAGTCGLFNIHWQHRSAELRIRIKTKLQGKGIGKEAGKLLISFGFNDLNLHRIYLTVFSDNETAISLYNRLGFRQEGLLRESVYIDGQYTDELLMGILRTDVEQDAGDQS